MIDILEKAKDKGKIEEVKNSNTNTNTKEVADDTKEYDMDDYVEVYSLRHGTLNLRSDTSKGGLAHETVTFEGYMSSMMVRVQLLKDLVQQNDKVFEKGWIYIPDKDLKEQLRINTIVNDTFIPNKIEEVLQGSAKNLVKFIDDLDRKGKKSFREIVTGKLSNNEIEKYEIVQTLKEKLGIRLDEDIR